MIRKRCIDCARCYKTSIYLPITDEEKEVYGCPIVPWPKHNKELYRFNRCYFYRNKEEI